MHATRIHVSPLLIKVSLLLDHILISKTVLAHRWTNVNVCVAELET